MISTILKIALVQFPLFVKSQKKIKSPTVRTIHHIDYFKEKKMIEFQEKSIRLCDVKIVVSKYWQNILLREYGIKSHLVYNGIDLKKFSYIEEKNRDKSPTILFVGGLEPRKGLEYLIFAMEKVLSDIPRAKLIVIGRSGLRKNHEDKWFRILVDRLNISKSVIFNDLVDDELLPLYYSSCDVFTLPSRMEGWGLSLMEAMACKKPVVATKVGGVPELVNYSTLKSVCVIDG